MKKELLFEIIEEKNVRKLMSSFSHYMTPLFTNPPEYSITYNYGNGKIVKKNFIRSEINHYGYDVKHDCKLVIQMYKMNWDKALENNFSKKELKIKKMTAQRVFHIYSKLFMSHHIRDSKINLIGESIYFIYSKNITSLQTTTIFTMMEVLFNRVVVLMVNKYKNSKQCKEKIVALILKHNRDLTKYLKNNEGITV